MLFGLWASVCAAQDTGGVRLSLAPLPLWLGDALEYATDADGQTGINDLIEQPSQLDWQAGQEAILNLGYLTAPHWYRLRIHNDQPLPRHLLLELAHPLFDDIRLYQVDLQGQLRAQSHSGDRLPFHTREIPHRYFLYPITLSAGDAVDVYFRIDTMGAHQIAARLWDEQTYYTDDDAALIAKSIYYGMIAILVFYNLFVWTVLRDRSYLYYVGFEACFVMDMALLHGLAFQYLLPNAPLLTERLMLMLVPGAMVFLCLFAMNILRTQNQRPALHKLLQTLVLAGAALVLLGAVGVAYRDVISLSLLYVASVSICLLLVSVLGSLRGDPTARYFLAAWCVFFTGCLLYVLNKQGWIPRNYVSEYGLMIGSVLEALLLSFALADRFNREREARFIAQSERLEAVKARQQAERELLFSSTHSARTGLPNQLLFQTRLQALLKAPDSGFALVLLHLKNFHAVNKTLGHGLANAVLKQFAEQLNMRAQLIHQLVTIEQTEQQRHYAATVEGVTFGLLLRCNGQRGTLASLDKLRLAVEHPVEHETIAINLGVVLGVAFFPEHGSDVETLQRHAHIAVDAADRHRQAMAVYSDDINPYNARRLALLGDLGKAIAQRDLYLTYQPQVCLRRCQVVGLECLLRWRHPQLGSVAPDEFIGLAEQNGLMQALTAQVLEQALAFAQRMHGAGLAVPLSINVSAANLVEAGFVQRLEQAVARAGIRRERLKLELTESAMMTDTDAALAVLDELASKGYRLSIDDFGTGHSSLAYIRRLPVQEIKIDRSFVLALAQQNEASVIVQTTIEMSHALGYTVVAEGVEDAATYLRLKQMGCDQVQGYFCARPMTEEQIMDWLSDEPDCGELCHAG